MKPSNEPALYIGLMSGTSLDGIDGALVQWIDDTPQTLAFDSAPLEPALRTELMALQTPGEDELHRSALAGVALASAYAQVCARLIAQAPAGADIRAIGAHGQTVRHRPQDGYTVQLLDGALLAELARRPVVCDFRSADIAAGGQGAPLVPAFHARVFGHPSERRAIVNLGGIANVSLLACDGTVQGFDTGPANVLLDLWATRTLGQPQDTNGALAARGRVNHDWLATLLKEPFFERQPPKSTGRDLFNPEWLDRQRSEFIEAEPADPLQRAADVQATLVELTALTVARACREFGAQAIYLCGGGAFNPTLVERIRQGCAPARVATTDALGAPPQAVEAVAFAWLARCRLEGSAGNLPAVTGANGPRVLGAIYSPIGS